MQEPSMPISEKSRQQAVEELNLDSIGLESGFERYARITSKALCTPMSALTVISRGRQLIKAAVGTTTLITSRAVSFCGHTILNTAPLVIADTNLDDRFKDNPLVTGAPTIRYYIGAPIRAPSGSNLGAICAIDIKPREVIERDMTMIADIAHMVENEILIRSLQVSDPLTELYARTSFTEISDRYWRRANSQGSHSALILISVDRYISRSRAWGRLGTNQILQMVSECIRSSFDEPDYLAAHMQDDRFAIFMTHRGPEEVRMQSEKIRTQIETIGGVGEHKFGRNVTVSIGATNDLMDRRRDRGIMDLFDRANRALLHSKSLGGNRCAYFLDDLAARSSDEVRRGSTAADLRLCSA